ncbi:glycosyltransferase family 1 protein [Brevibacillus choshinensis]|uniref:glycosyltransferase family 4 protein n=1 Tax=Brevibacillus choshinensis TaxID=54911 RepID=UPI002E1E5D5D|nr:glycosyltransferase family 1 protein [Brevibacillus choshinensis]MED4753941.1 glycosyltransferase family 1 protein [Brevibacillus choshinensis]MED4779072.1 glycosyltransferase family 1 protein [Brevibacillus choshinensis]
MQIGINLISLFPGKIGGMEQYIRNLLSFSNSIANDNEWYLFLNSHNFDTFEADDTIHKVLSPNLEDLSEWLRQRICLLKLDLWFCPLMKLIPQDVPIPSVINIPDIQHEFFPQFFKPDVLRWRQENYKSSANCCQAVLTLSEYSKNSIIQKYRLPEHKVHAIHLDSSVTFPQYFSEEVNRTVREKYRLADDYGFYPANTWYHKNHLNLLKALVVLRQKYDLVIQMVLTGSSQEAHESVMQYIENNHLDNQVKWVDYVPQEEMPYLYRNAGFLCFPSLFEGFGIPLVEAMRSHIPIVCSNTGSIPEVVGIASLMFDPNIPEDIAEKMAAIQCPEIRRDLIAKGVAQAKQFSWEKCARQTWEVFLSVAKPDQQS